jgi:hypothetical protein
MTKKDFIQAGNLLKLQLIQLTPQRHILRPHKTPIVFKSRRLVAFVSGLPEIFYGN